MGSFVQEINDKLRAILPGTTRFYGLVREKGIQDKIELVTDTEIVSPTDDQYDTIIFHRETEGRKLEKRKFGYRSTATIALCCYCKDGAQYDRIQAIFGHWDEVTLTGENTDAMDVLRRYFNIEDPTKNIGYNQECYAFAFLYEVTTFRNNTDPEICCETTTEA